ncbi:MAG: hypothetical protein U0840_29995 [Gemmataceae bacterium]
MVSVHGGIRVSPGNLRLGFYVSHAMAGLLARLCQRRKNKP